MNTPASMKGNLTRYGVFLAMYLIVIGIKELTVMGNKVHPIWETIFFIVSLLTLLFFIRRFNREERYFTKEPHLSLLGDYSFIFGLTILVIASHVFLAYLQARGRFPMFTYQAAYAKKDSTPMFWFLVASVGVVLPVLQQFLTVGFFFNYLFRHDDLIVGLVGVIFSGIFYGLLNFQPSLSLFFINVLYGMAFAWSYLYSQSLWVPIYLSILSGIFSVLFI